MKKYITTFLFYAIAAAVIFILDKISPVAHDGGPGMGLLALLLLPAVVLVLLGINVYKGFRVDKAYFLLAVIHLAGLLVILKLFFI